MDINGIPFSTPRNINLKGVNSTKGSALRFQRTSSTNPFDSSSNGLYINGSDQLVFTAQGVESILGSAGSLVNYTLNDAYDDGSTITLDADPVTLAASGTGNIFVLTLSGSGTGNMIDIQNDTTGTAGYDIQGTGDTWSFTSAGVLIATGLTMGDDELITLGATSDVTIEWENASSFLDVTGAVNFNGNLTLEAGHTLTMAGTAGSDIVILTAGDLVLSEGSITLTDDDNATSLSVTNDGATSETVVQFLASTVTTGTLLNLSLDESALNGGYFLTCIQTDGPNTKFSIAENGATVIGGSAAGTQALTVTAGDFVVDDTDASKFESENGTTTLLTVDNKAGVIADNLAALLVDAGGAVASGGNALRVIFSGTADAGAILAEFLPDAGSLGVKIDAGEVDSDVALYVDADPTSVDVAYLHSDAVIASDKAVLNVTSAGAIASGGNAMRVDVTGTPGAGAIYCEFDFAGMTDTNENIGVLIDAGGKKVRALYIDADPIAEDVVYIHSDAVIADNKAVLSLHSAGAIASGSNVFRIATAGTPDTGAIVFEMDAQDDCQAIKVDTDSITTDAVLITHSGNLATGKAVLYVTDAGTPAADPVAVIKGEFTGTATHESYIFQAQGTGKDVVGLYIDTDNTVAANSGSIVAYNNTTDAQGPSIVGHHDSATPAASDQILGIYAYAEEATSSDTMLYGQMTFEVVASTNGAIEGGVKIGVADGASLRESIYLTDDHLGLGDSAAFTIGTTGSFDLSISTAVTVAGVAANEPKIVLTDGATGNITITAGGTSGEIDIASPLVYSSNEDIDDADPSLTTLVTTYKTGAARARTLGDGVEGQIKVIVMDTDGGTLTLTVTNGHGFNTLTFDDTGEGCTLLFTDSDWAIIGVYGATASTV